MPFPATSKAIRVAINNLMECQDASSNTTTGKAIRHTISALTRYADAQDFLTREIRTKRIVLDDAATLIDGGDIPTVNGLEEISRRIEALSVMRGIVVSAWYVTEHLLAAPKETKADPPPLQQKDDPHPLSPAPPYEPLLKKTMKGFENPDEPKPISVTKNPDGSTTYSDGKLDIVEKHEMEPPGEEEEIDEPIETPTDTADVPTAPTPEVVSKPEAVKPSQLPLIDTANATPTGRCQLTINQADRLRLAIKDHGYAALFNLIAAKGGKNWQGPPPSPWTKAMVEPAIMAALEKPTIKGRDLALAANHLDELTEATSLQKAEAEDYPSDLLTDDEVVTANAMVMSARWGGGKKVTMAAKLGLNPTTMSNVIARRNPTPYTGVLRDAVAKFRLEEARLNAAEPIVEPGPAEPIQGGFTRPTEPVFPKTVMYTNPPTPTVPVGMNNPPTPTVPVGMNNPPYPPAGIRPNRPFG